VTARYAVVLAACAAPPAPAPVANVAATAAVARPQACPDLLVAPPWTSEQFPGCPSPAFDTAFPVCGDRCPTPCRRTREHGGQRELVELAYDASGRWIESRRNGAVVDACSYRGDRSDACTWDTTAYALARGSGGEIVEARQRGARGKERYRYAATGELVEAGDWDIATQGWDVDSTFTYDSHRRLVAQHDYRPPDLAYLYDRAGRLVERDERYPTELVRTRLSYDAGGRLSRVDSGPTSGSGSFVPYTISYVYDDRDRLVRSVAVDGKHATDIVTFDYCDDPTR
jgi:hypothetical protein